MSDTEDIIKAVVKQIHSVTNSYGTIHVEQYVKEIVHGPDYELNDPHKVAIISGTPLSSFMPYQAPLFEQLRASLDGDPVIGKPRKTSGKSLQSIDLGPNTTIGDITLHILS